MNNYYTREEPNHKFLAKKLRGFGIGYDVILEVYNNIHSELPKSLLEIGIGNLGSHRCWLTVLPESTIYGLDSANFSLDWSRASGEMRQWINCQEGIFHYTQLPFKQQKRLQLHWNVDGYHKDTAQQFYDCHGAMDIIVNDGKQDGVCHNWLVENWKDKVSETGVIIQDKLGRAGAFHGLYINQIDKAVKNGWALYDCRAYTEMDDNVTANGIFAIYAQRPEYAQELDKHLPRIYSHTDLNLREKEKIDDIQQEN